MNTISVIIPTYKSRGGLVRAIESALHQNYENLEVIVVDDNDPNSEERHKTEKIVERFLKDERFQYIKHKENRNGAAARNTGIHSSKGDYIAFLDDDDWFLEGKLEKQALYLEEHPEYDAVYCLAQYKGKPYLKKIVEGDCTREILMMQSSIYTPCQMFRREALMTIKGYDETFRRHQDYDLLLRFFHAGYKIGCIREILVEIGENGGENIPTGDKLENLKKYFFEKFSTYIDEINRKEPGFKKLVMARHYASVFLSHVKNHYYRLSIKVYFKYFFKSPWTFSAVVVDSIRKHL